MNKCSSCNHYHCHICYNQAEYDGLNINCVICGTVISLEEFKNIEIKSITIDEVWDLYEN